MNWNLSSYQRSLNICSILTSKSEIKKIVYIFVLLSTVSTTVLAHPPHFRPCRFHEEVDEQELRDTENSGSWNEGTNTQTIISVASASVALAALFISLWNAWATRCHNRLSVRPNLSIIKHILPNSPQLRIIVRNNGLGPAIITGLHIFIDDSKQTFTRATHWQDIVAKLRIFGGTINGYAMHDTESLRPGDELLLLEIIDCTKTYNTQDIHTEIARLKIAIDYSSMYGDTFIEKLRK